MDFDLHEIIVSVIHLIYLFTGTVVCFFSGLFAASSLRERKPRAALISLIILITFGVIWFGAFVAFSLADGILLTAEGVVLLFVLLFFMPHGKSEPLDVKSITKRVDERDIIFAREEYLPGTEKYEQYYAMRPEYKKADDRLRKLPALMSPGGRFYEPVQAKYINSIFGIITEMTTRVDGQVNFDNARADPTDMTMFVKDITLRLGADDVGIAILNPMYVYSHVGRGPEKWGSPIENNHKYAVAFALEMDYFKVETAPQMPITEESAVQYLKAAQISITLAEYIRSLGYSARAHISDSNYQIMLSPVAHDAGLGELGRLGYLISPKFGPRIRLGAVTTDLPLIPDRPINFGVQDFCTKCLKCALNCPSRAIPDGDKTDIRGVEKWQLNIEQCLLYWRMAGTDCGLCMKVCPYSHPPTVTHNVIRAGIRRSSFARRISIRGDNLFYGKNVHRDSELYE